MLLCVIDANPPSFLGCGQYVRCNCSVRPNVLHNRIHPDKEVRACVRETLHDSADVIAAISALTRCFRTHLHVHTHAIVLK